MIRWPALPFATTLPVLGIAVRFESNSEHVMRLVNDRFGGWLNALGNGTLVTESVAVRIAVRGDASAAHGANMIEHLDLGDGRLLVESADSVGLADPLRRESMAHVSPALVEDPRFPLEFLDAITFSLLAHFDRHPIHAAGLLHEERAILLAGGSGMGKSTLAHMAHRMGIAVLSDDHVWVQQDPTMRVWGGPPRARLITDGAEKVSVPLEQPGTQVWMASSGVTLCVLARGATASLARVDAHVLERELHEQLAPGFDRFPQRHRDVARLLSAHGGWRLTLTSRPADALNLLHAVVENATNAG
ncbi:MAG: hypothetical protein V4550_11760 [Gemmatimonadota bacterium]